MPSCPQCVSWCRHPIVDGSGLVNSPYLGHWAYPRSNLQEMAQASAEAEHWCRASWGSTGAESVGRLKVGSTHPMGEILPCPLQDMSMLFGSDPPLYSKPPNHPSPSHQPSSGAMSTSSSGGAGAMSPTPTGSYHLTSNGGFGPGSPGGDAFVNPIIQAGPMAILCHTTSHLFIHGLWKWMSPHNFMASSELALRVNDSALDLDNTCHSVRCFICAGLQLRVLHHAPIRWCCRHQ